MARYIPNSAYDAYFAFFTACTRQDLTSDVSTPTDLTGSLANVTLDSGDFTIGAGDNGGRKLTIAEQIQVDVTADGTTRHAVLSYFNDPTWEIRMVTTTVEREVSNTLEDKVNMGSWYLDVAGPENPVV